MPKAKKVNTKSFNKMNETEQAKELKKMAKRANVRLSLLEETDITNESYKQAEQYNIKQGKEKNRFYEGVKYKTKEAIKSAFNALTNFLNSKKSTLSGIHAEIDTLIEKGQFDTNTLKKLSEKEKIYVAKKGASIANKRLAELEKEGIDYYAYAKAKHYNEATGRDKNRFYRGSKFRSERDLNIHIQNIFDFLNAESSTAEGIKNINDRRINMFKEKGVNIPKGREKDFYDFLSSEQFKNLGKYADSNQIIETFVDARKMGLDVDLINEEFTNFMNGELDFDEVQEKLHVAKWQKGGLLK
jgi:hypothetical protein